MKHEHIARAQWSTYACVVTALIALAGCNTTMQQKDVPPEVSQRLAPIRDQIADLRNQIQNTSAAAGNLVQTPQNDLTSQIDRLDNQLGELKTGLQTGRAKVESVDAATQTYFVNWDQQLKTMSDDMAKAGGARLQQAEATYTKLKTNMYAFRDQVRPYMGELNEAVTYLRTDRTKSGLSAVEPKIRQALNRQSTMMSQLDELTAEIDAMQGTR